MVLGSVIRRVRPRLTKSLTVRCGTRLCWDTGAFGERATPANSSYRESRLGADGGTDCACRDAGPVVSIVAASSVDTSAGRPRTCSMRFVQSEGPGGSHDSTATCSADSSLELGQHSREFIQLMHLSLKTIMILEDIPRAEASFL